MKKEPNHAELPLWEDKNLKQKINCLSELLEDLNVYTERKNLPKIIVEIPEDDVKVEECKALVLGKYSEILNEDIGIVLYNLERLMPADEQERINKNKIHEYILSTPNILNKNCELGHITGSGLVIDVLNKKILLHKHKKLGLWLQFGGHPDYELNPLLVALRESKEESGLDDLKLVSYHPDTNIPIDVDLQIIPEKSPKPEHYHFDFRYLLATETPTAVKALAGESEDFWWISVEEALKQPDSVITLPVKRLIAKAGNYFEKH